jgi:hypothetical protein
MPFKSEKQRRYLWANEPEIAKDWTDTYGSKINAADGGIMRLPFAEGSGEEVIVDTEGLVYDESPLSNNYTEEEFNEIFAKPEENNFKMPNLNFLSGLYSIADKSLPLGWASSALNFMGENNPLNFLNRNRTMTPQQQANQNYINQYGRTPQGRLATGDFAGLNAPGTSMFGSKSQQEMAQNWMNKYGDVEYTIPKMQQKKTSIAAQAAGDGGNNNAGGASLSGGMTTGQHAAFRAARGGIAGLWQK